MTVVVGVLMVVAPPVSMVGRVRMGEGWVRDLGFIAARIVGGMVVYYPTRTRMCADVRR